MGKRGGWTNVIVRWAFCGALLAVLVAAPAAVAAKPDALDPSFGEGGRAATVADLGSSWQDAPVHLASAPDGSTVVASERQISRYLPNGQLDQGFGEGGKVTPGEVEGLSFSVADVAIDETGRVVVFGTATGSKTTMVYAYPVETQVQPTFAVVLRYDAAGELDPSFGGGDGVFRTDLGLRLNLIPSSEREPPPPLLRMIAGDVDPRGRPVFVAAPAAFVGLEHGSTFSWLSRAVVRLTPTGELDGSFGKGQGFALLSSTGNRGVAIGPESEPLLVWGGRWTGEARPITQVTRLHADGTTDSGYGTNGMRTFHGGGGAAALDRFGRLLILERPGNGPARVLRLKANGNLDPSFGRDGSATVKLPGRGSAFSSITVDARGRALVVGTAMRSQGDAGTRGKAGGSLAVVRLQSSGRLDPRFGHRGWIETGFGHATNLAAAHEVARTTISGPQAVLDPQGRLVVAAAAQSPQLQPSGIVLARYLLGD